MICGAASRADQVVTDRAQGSSIRSATALASASAARTSKLHVCVQRAAGLMQTQNLISNGYGSQCWLTHRTERPMELIMMIVILMMMMIICLWHVTSKTTRPHVSLARV